MMELTEISDRIDIKLNSFEIPIEVDEYEKSLYLTEVQKKFYKELCDAFEADGVISIYLQPFVTEFVTANPIVTVTKETMLNNTTNIVVPSDIYRVMWEKGILSSTDIRYNLKEVKVIKTSIATIPYKTDNPFRTPNNKEIFRVITGNTELEIFELMLPEEATLLQYACKYFKDIKPIILEALPDSLTIEDETGPLNTEFTDEILERIIELTVKSILQDKTAISKQQNV